MNRSIRVSLVVVLVLIGALAANGGSKSWVPTTGGTWGTAGNWNPSGVPAVTDTVTIGAQSGNITGLTAGGVTLAGLKITGNCNLNTTTTGDTLKITGIFTVAAGTTLNLGPITRMNAVLTSTCTGFVDGTATISGTTARFLQNSGDLSIASTGLINGLGAFALNSGATLRIGSTAGITTTGATGNVQTALRAFDTGANYVYNGAAAQVTGNALPSTPFLVVSLTINNSAGVTLTAGVTAVTLNLTSGDLTLGAFGLTATTVNGGSTSSYVATTGAGVLTRTGLVASDVTFPIGTAATYNPITINNSGAGANYSARVATAFTNLPHDTTICLRRDWIVSKTGGATSATITLGWNGAPEEGGSFLRGNPIAVGVYGPVAVWVETASSTVGGGPYTASATITGTGQFSVCNLAGLPIQLASFAAVAASGNTVNLNWGTISETNNYGFEVQKSQTNSAYQSIAGSFQKGFGTTNDPQQYSYKDASATPGAWYYRLKQIDLDNTVHYTDGVRVDVPTGTTGVATAPEKPAVYSLSQNYPNPFNPSTKIHFGIPAGGFVSLKVYNLLGQEVATLVNELRGAGYHDVVFDAKNLSSGMYVYRLTAGEFSSVKTLVLVK